MLRYTINRLLITIPMLLIASFVMFMMVSMAGDPLSRVRSTDPPPPEESVLALERHLGLDKPVLERYFSWLAGLFRGDFGNSIMNVEIGQELGTRMVVSFRLIFLAIILAAIVAIIIGVVSALRQYGVLDNLLSTVTFVALSVPVFWIGILFKHWAVGINQAAGETIFYTIGDGSNVGASGFALVGFLALPTLVLTLNIFASWSRYVRASMVEVLNSDYMKLARAKGLSRRQAVTRHGIRNALMPFVTIVALDFSALVGGAIVTEAVFQWRGMGDLLLTGVRNLDVHVVMAWLLVFATATILLNLIADLVYGLLDPRIRHA